MIADGAGNDFSVVPGAEVIDEDQVGNARFADVLTGRPASSTPLIDHRMLALDSLATGQ